MDDANRLLLSQAERLLPDGYTIVPLEPTEAMMATVDCAGDKRDWPSGQMWRHFKCNGRRFCVTVRGGQIYLFEQGENNVHWNSAPVSAVTSPSKTCQFKNIIALNCAKI